MNAEPAQERFYCPVSGMENGRRVDSRVLEERIQQAVEEGYRRLDVEAFGQHGIGGRLWLAGDGHVHVNIYGPAGQRVGAMGLAGTTIEVMGPASDDLGWLNAGAEIIVHGHAANGVANAMAQGTIYVGGSVGARAMTMTKHNPRFAPPELWVLGSAGDYFAEFMAGGIAVVCGYQPQDPSNILGYRPCVGMVGGRIFFRGPHKGYSRNDAWIVPISDDDWDWLVGNLAVFLDKIDHSHILDELSGRGQWQLLAALDPYERATMPRRSMAAFAEEVWGKELGPGGLIGDLTNIDRSPISVITTGDLSRFAPVWQNKQYMAPCDAACPTGMPVRERWRLIREGRIAEAVDMALAYTPFPATVCGYLCPGPCMQACTRQAGGMAPLDVKQLGRASLDARLPEMPASAGGRVAVIGGGPAGISVAWQLRRQGHEAVVFDMEADLGGKIKSAIPKSRIPDDVVDAELDRVRKVLPHVRLQQRLGMEDFERLKSDHDFVVIAAGARKPRLLSVPGSERIIPAVDFLRQGKEDKACVGRRVVIIGAGNVGCDVATEAYRAGAEEITLIHYRRPPAHGAERDATEAIGARFLWPCSTAGITEEGVRLTTGEVIPAETVVMATGHLPDLDFLPETVATDRGFVAVNDFYQTSDPKVFAIGDVVKLGLITDAIGAGRIAAEAISAILAGKQPERGSSSPKIDCARVRLEYLDPRLARFNGVKECAEQCASCGACRDCGVCVSICPQGAISRQGNGNGSFEMKVDAERCIGCGFCAGACPCGIWGMKEKELVA